MELTGIESAATSAPEGAARSEKDADPATPSAAKQPEVSAYVYGAPIDVDAALKLAIKLAVDEGDYEYADELLKLARRPRKRAAAVTPLAVVRRDSEQAGK